MNYDGRIEITEEIRTKLVEEKRRTGVGPYKLLGKLRHAKSEGLRAYMIDNWISGDTVTAYSNHLDYVIRLWAVLPDAPEMVLLMPHHIDEMRFHQRRTCIGPVNILKIADDVPEGMHWNCVNKWLSSTVRSVQKQHLEYALNLWRSLPPHADYTGPLSYEPEQERADASSLMTLDDPMLLSARHAIEDHGIWGSWELLRGHPECPDDLTYTVIEKLVSTDHEEYYRHHILFIAEVLLISKILLALEAEAPD